MDPKNPESPKMDDNYRIMRKEDIEKRKTQRASILEDVNSQLEKLRQLREELGEMLDSDIIDNPEFEQSKELPAAEKLEEKIQIDVKKKPDESNI